jgi:hypothetical protein
MIKYQPFKPVIGNAEPEDLDNQAYNISIFAEGVRGVHCIELREPTRGERLDYEQFAPAGSMISCVGVYENGAKNFYVRTKLEYKQIGVITIRPMLPYDAEKEYKPLTK